MQEYIQVNETPECLFRKYRSLALDVVLPEGSFQLHCDFICPSHSHFTFAIGFHHPTPPFSRLFFIKQNSATIRMDGKNHYLEPGDICLLPAEHPFFADYSQDLICKVFHIHLYDGLGFPLAVNLPTLQKYRQKVLTDAVFQLVDSAPDNVLDPLVISALMPLLTPEFPTAANRLSVPMRYRQLLEKIHQIPPAKLRLDKLAAQTGSSRSALGKGFKQYFRMSFKDYQKNLLLNQARRLLLDDRLSITEIADQLGFERVFYFIDFFHRTTGTTPGEFRKHPLQ